MTDSPIRASSLTDMSLNLPVYPSQDSTPTQMNYPNPVAAYERDPMSGSSYHTGSPFDTSSSRGSDGERDFIYRPASTAFTDQSPNSPYITATSHQTSIYNTPIESPYSNFGTIDYRSGAHSSISAHYM
jgi:hypothetical protein